jgi:D-3-phosphoglycerate dehydrogenase
VNTPPSILVCDDISRVGLQLLDHAGFSVVRRAGIGREELARRACDFDALLVRSRTRITAQVLDAAPGLRLVGRAGFGVDTIDVAAASERGVVVMTSAEGNAVSAAEFAIGLIFALARNIPQADASMRSGRWDKRRYRGTEITGKVLGVIGMGRVGRIVVERAAALRMRVLVHDPARPPSEIEAAGGKAASWDELLGNADFLTVHVNSSTRTRGLIGDAAFELMKDRVRIVHCSRGGVVDEAALVRALRSGKVAGAAVDVFEQEPPTGNPLTSMPQVIVTPHLVASTFEAQINVATTLAEQVRDFLTTGETRGAINPEALTRAADKAAPAGG